MASVGMVCNTNPLFKVPVTPDPQKVKSSSGLNLPLLLRRSCPAHSLGSALQGGPAWGRHPSNVSYALSSSVPPKGQLSI